MIHLAVGSDKDGVVTACGPADPIPNRTTCPQCRRNPLYNFELPIALRPNEARRLA